ncbi:ligand-binding sensor domain-containing protein [Pedobacter sp. MW01-1-1]|uniref:ligand-binding sensor domain-containing protein n=1 Tax=Pedobacter sp. MW01-1-1 TaxID=3383027 RepID=UPI003FF0AEFE
MPQSQVSVIYQAKDRALWLGTFGGVSTFDGQDFVSYSKVDGLCSNSIMDIVEGDNGAFYVGNEAGLNKIHKGKVSTISKSKNVYCFQKDKAGVIWGIASNKLFKIAKGKQIFIPFDTKLISAITLSKEGLLFVSVYGDGIYTFQKNTWKRKIVFPEALKKLFFFKIKFDKYAPDQLLLLSNNAGLFALNNNQFSIRFKQKQIDYYCDFEQDYKEGLWIGTERGAYLEKKSGELFKFDASNGLGDNRVDKILCDAENNIWVSCFSQGFFRYDGDTFTLYNKFNGKSLPYAVSGIGADEEDNLWIGTFNKGLLKYDGKTVEPVTTPQLTNRYIYFVYTDWGKNIWVSAQKSGIWCLQGKKFKQVLKSERHDFNSILLGAKGELWLSGEKELLCINSSSQIKEIHGFDAMISCLFEKATDSVFVGTSSGVVLVRDKSLDPSFRIKELEESYILSIVKYKNQLLFCTLGDGLVSWDKETKKVQHYAVANGLNSNDVYSAVFDEEGHLWVGTGRGINKLIFDEKSKKFQVFNDNPLIVECNQGAILNFKRNILVGSIDGLIRCNIGINNGKTPNPLLNIKSIVFYNRNDKNKDYILDDSAVNKDLHTFKADQNHLAISFKSICLVNQKGVRYRYRLIGVDSNFSKEQSNTQVEYSALQPGSYTFEVYAVVNGLTSDTKRFSFVIAPPYYETLLFKVLLSITSLLLIWLVFYLFFRNRERKKDEMETMKRVEQEKIRKQTAEDFHDDIGNKLTRINILSEILDKKLEVGDSEQKELTRLIRENAGLLYNSTKDILWALDPKSDNLWEILQHIKNFGIDLFQNTGVQFKMEGIVEEYQKIKLPMEFNRNLTLIFKETLNNVLKHAQATEVFIMVLRDDQHCITILTTDNGKGFEVDKVPLGRGLNNIQTRCKRIKSTFTISSSPEKGTTSIIGAKIFVTNSKSRHL